jgi:hypothetical protein
MLISALALLASQNIDPRPAAKEPATYAELMAARVPVTTNDILDRPYRVLGRVKRNVRKATIFSRGATPEKLQDELWERGQKVGADAVLNARYGGERVTGMSWGANKVEGDAVHFLTEAEIKAAKPR